MRRIDRLERLELALRGGDWPDLLVVVAAMPAPWNDHKGDIPRHVQEQWIAEGLADMSHNRKCVTYHGGRAAGNAWQIGAQHPAQWPMRVIHSSP